MTAASLSWRDSGRAGLALALALAAGFAASPAAADTGKSDLAVGATVVETCRVSTGTPARAEASASCGTANPASIAAASSRTATAPPGERPPSTSRTQPPADSGGVTYVTFTY